MSHPLVSHKKAKNISVALFLLALAILSYNGNWWPGILLGIGIPLAFKQYLSGKKYDVVITLLVFIGGFFCVSQQLSEHIILPILFIIGAIYILSRDWIEATTLSEKEQEEDKNEEIEETQSKH